MARFWFVTVGICLILCPPVYSQDETPAPETLRQIKLDECVREALKNNLEIRIERVNPEIAAQEVRGEWGAFDPVYRASVDYEDDTIPLPSQAAVAAGGLGEIETELLTFATSIEGKIPTGLTYNVGADQGRGENTFNRFHSEYDTFAGVTLTQPLLKDFWLDNNLAQVRIARKNKQISVAQFRQRVIDVVARVRDAYWNYVFTIEEDKVQHDALVLARDLLELNRKKLDAGVISPLEVTQAEAGVAAREDNVIVSARLIRDQENALKQLIYSDMARVLDVRLHPVDPPTVNLRPIDVKQAIAVALKKRPEMEQIRTELEKLAVEVKYTRNQTLPQVDLQGSYGVNGLNGNSGGSIDDAATFDNPSWSVGAALELPLWNRKNKSEAEIAGLRKKQALSRLKQTEQRIVAEVDNACRKVQSGLKRVEATQASRKAAQEALEAEQTKLRNGASTSHTVLEFQEDLTQARTAEVQALVEYNKSLNDLARVQGTLLEELKIELAQE